MFFSRKGERDKESEWLIRAQRFIAMMYASMSLSITVSMSYDCMSLRVYFPNFFLEKNEYIWVQIMLLWKKVITISILACDHQILTWKLHVLSYFFAILHLALTINKSQGQSVKHLFFSWSTLSHAVAPVYVVRHFGILNWHTSFQDHFSIHIF